MTAEMTIVPLKDSSKDLSQDFSKDFSKDFRFPIRVYWEDTDAGSIVYYANYLKFFERARSEWLRQLGVEQGKLLFGEGCMFVVSEIQTKFHFPARIDDLLAVTVRIKKIGHASLYLHQAAFIQTGSANAPTSQLACEGSVRLACVQQSTMRPTAIPKSIVSLIS
jgi:acyl-CoA thioester hydrolase